MKRRGTTIIETLVYIALLGLAFSSIYAVLLAGLKYFNTANATSDLQNACVTGTTELVRELSESDIATVQVASPGVSFASPRDADGAISINSAGAMLWQKFVCYYVDSSHNLVRKEKLLSTPVTAVSSLTSQLSSNTPTTIANSTARARFLGGNITSLTVTTGANSNTELFSIVADQRDKNGNLVTDKNGNALNEVQVGPVTVILQN